MIFTELNEREYTVFCDASEQKNFMQTKYLADYYEMEKTEHWLVGVKENDEVIAATLLIAHKEKLLGQSTFDCLQGPIMDWHNEELVSFFTKEIKKFVKKHGGYRVLINPYIPSQQRDTYGNVVEGGVNNLSVKNELISLGYKYLDYYWQVKWVYCKDINGMDEKALFKTFQSSVRNHINKTHKKYDLTVRLLGYDELDEFKHITEITSERRGFSDRTIEYYQRMFNAFGDQARFYICELNIDNYISRMESENKEAQRKIDTLSDSISNQNKKKECAKIIESNNKNLEEAHQLREEYGSTLPLSAALFMLYGDETIYLFSGSDERYMKFFGQYRLQWEILKYCVENNYRRHNFYGIMDVFNPEKIMVS